MFANTLSVTIGTDSARILTRINQDSFGSTYRLATALELTELVIRNSTSKEKNLLYDRHNAELRHTVYATDLLPERHYVASTTFKSLSETQYSLEKKSYFTTLAIYFVIFFKFLLLS